MSALVFVLAAAAEIGGCYAFWAVARLGAPPWVMAGGTLLLMAFAGLLTQAPVDVAGRAYAAYGGVYVAASLVWLVLVEGRLPDRWDLVGSVLCLAGAAVILFGPRGGLPG